MNIEAINAVTLDSQQWEAGTFTFASTIIDPGAKAWWAMRRQAFAAGFRSYFQTSWAIQDIPSIEQLIRGDATKDSGLV